MYLLKSKLSHLFIMDDNGLMTSKQEKALSFIDEAAGKLYMAQHGFSIQYYELFYSAPNEKDTKDDPVNHPSHYTAYSREVIDTMEGVSTPEEFRGHLKLTALKYLSRYQGKNGVEDLNKAIWYATKLRDFVKDTKDE